MYCLFLDLSFEIGTVALIKDEELLVSIQRPSREMQSLLYDIETLLLPIGINSKTIDFFALASGPGSYTGLRNAASVIKTLSYAESKPIIEVPSLLAFIPGIQEMKGLCAVIADAKIGGFYMQRFNRISAQHGDFPIDLGDPFLVPCDSDEIALNVNDVDLVFSALSEEELKNKLARSVSHGYEGGPEHVTSAAIQQNLRKFRFVDAFDRRGFLAVLPHYLSHQIQSGKALFWNSIKLKYLRKTQAEIETSN